MKQRLTEHSLNGPSSRVPFEAPATLPARVAPTAQRHAAGEWLRLLLPVLGLLAFGACAGLRAAPVAGDGQQPAAATVSTAVGTETASPAAVISALQQHLLTYMSAARAADGNVSAESVATLRQQILDTHDFNYIARIVLGRHWRSLDEQRRSAFTERFTDLSLTTYAIRFAEFAGETFEITGEAESAFGQRSVEASLVTRDGQHSFEYLLRGNDEGDWKIVNIIVDGISDLALKRAEYATLFSDAGFDGLMTELERQRLELDGGD
jgi:phospholipid transport system substrate-binding protein